MNPDAEDGGQDDQAATLEFDTWRALQKATDKKRADLIADIVGHPKGLPSVEELAYTNPKLSDDAIRRHLSTLADVEVIQVRTIETGERVRADLNEVLTDAGFGENGSR